MKRIEIKSLLSGEKVGEKVLLKAWVRTFRSNRFIALNDGSTIKNIQAVIEKQFSWNEAKTAMEYISAGHASGKVIIYMD